MIPVFIGYDPREAIAYHACSNSIIRHASQPVSLHPYSRFLVPHMMNYDGWAIFIDGDMILRDDIAKLWALRDESKAVQVVQHDYETKMTEKYLGAKNENYPKKNWSSVILWNCAHPANKTVTPDFVKSATGAQVHRFTWLKDDLVGALPTEWNWLDIEYDYNPDAKLVHYTLGTPCFADFAARADSNYAAEWHRERIYTDYSKQHDLPF